MVKKAIELASALPELARELIDLALKSDRPELADQIPKLKILSRCACGDHFCATFYTGSDSAVRGPGTTLDLEAKRGMIIVDLDAEGRICTVEILNRWKYREALDRLLPLRAGKRV